MMRHFEDIDGRKARELVRVPVCALAFKGVLLTRYSRPARAAAARAGLAPERAVARRRRRVLGAAWRRHGAACQPLILSTPNEPLC